MSPEDEILAVFAETIPGKVTIDQTDDREKPGSEVGFLNFARRNNPSANKHLDTDGAIRFLRGGGAATTVIVGHGGVGFINSGGGKTAQNYKQFLSVGTAYYWEQWFSTLKGYTSKLYLFGCRPGAGRDGAELLYRMARVLECEVVGPTGAICINSNGTWYLQSGAIWNSATPNRKPDVIPPLSPTMDPQYDHIAIMNDDAMEVYSVESITEMSFSPVRRSFDRQAPLWQSSENTAQELYREFGVGGPIHDDCKKAFAATGYVSMKVGGIEKKFLVLDDDILQDEQYPDIYYECHSSVSKKIMQRL